MGHFVEKGFRFRRRSLDHRPVQHLNDCKFAPTDRADRWGLNRGHLIGSGVFPAMARMADPRFPFLLSVFFRGSLFDGEFRGGRGGAEEPFLLLSLQVAELRFQLLVLFEKFVDTALPSKHPLQYAIERLSIVFHEWIAEDILETAVTVFSYGRSYPCLSVRPR